MSLSEISELSNPRVSYQILITFDLRGAGTDKYRQIRESLADEYIKPFIYLSDDDAREYQELPHNTLAVIWSKDTTEQETRDYFKKTILDAFKKHKVNGCYVILVAQNWAVAAGEF